jgi:hypothetical protein
VYGEVRRDLNVAVTRARHQLVFIGDATWLGKHAKAGSGYGTLWTHLQATAPIVDVRELLGERLRSRVADGSLLAMGWEAGGSSTNMTLLDEGTFYPEFVADLKAATNQVVLYTPYIGKRRWPTIEPHITAAAERVEVVVVHKPLTDEAWRRGDPSFGRAVLDRLAAAGVKLVPISGVHAKTILIDGHLVYEGSLNWASQTDSYEHMLRIDRREVAALVERMLQVREIVEPFHHGDARCPSCHGPLMVVNQREQRTAFGDDQPLKFGCIAHQTTKSCSGYLRGVHERAPFLQPPQCDKETTMTLEYTKNGKPWSWKCGHATCRPIRWRRGDVQVS